MTNEHITAELLELFSLGKLGPDDHERVKVHLSSCVSCRNLVSNACEENREMGSMKAIGGDEPAGSRYEGILTKVFESIREESFALDLQRGSASSLVRELENLDFNQQRLMVSNSARFHLWGFAEELLVLADATKSEDPTRSEQFAALAFEVAENLTAPGFRERVLNDLRAESWAYMANARRIRSDLQSAGEAFQVAESYLSIGTGDLMELARLFDLKSSLARANRDFSGAGELLDRAIGLYRDGGDRHLEGKALINKARLLFEGGDICKSVDVMLRAGDLLDRERDPWTAFLHKWNLVAYLNEANRPREAHNLLPEVRALAREHGNRLDRLRVLWVEGLVCSSLGQVEMAEEALKQVREGFIDAGIGYDVALVSLDLAALYLEQGRTAEVKTLGAETIPQFLARNIDREALAAIALFQEAARRERATLALVRDTAERIKTARSRPDRPD